MSDDVNRITTGPMGMRSVSTAKLAEALSKAQAVMSAAKKATDNPYHSTKYADMAEVLAVCREPLASNGLAHSAGTYVDNGIMILRTTLMHTSGEWIASELLITPQPGSKNINQAIGAAITYARRYGFMSLVGVVAAGEDTDHVLATDVQASIARAGTPGRPHPGNRQAPKPGQEVMTEKDFGLFCFAMEAASDMAELEAVREDIKSHAGGPLKVKLRSKFDAEKQRIARENLEQPGGMAHDDAAEIAAGHSYYHTVGKPEE